VERDKSLDMALSQIEKQYGKGAIMRLGSDHVQKVAAIPTGALSLDLALGIGGVPRGRIVEIYGPESGGKCLPADTYLWTDHGLETVAELFERCGQAASCTSRVTDVSHLGVRMVNEQGELEPVTALTHNNLRPVVRITVRSGRTIEATHNHPLRVVDESGFIVWRNAGDIAAGDVVVSGTFGSDEAASGGGLSEDEAILLGYLVAEGSLRGSTAIRFTNRDPEVGGEFTAIMEQLFGANVKQYNDQEYVVHSKALRTRFAEEYGLAYVNAAGKTVPPRVRTAGAKAQRSFLSALFEGDGWIDTSSTVGYASASEQLAREVQLLLYGFGIPATLTPKWNPQYERDYWTVTVNSAASDRFIERIGFRSERRRAQVERNFQASPRDPQFENIPNVSNLVRALRDSVGGDREFDRIAGDLFRSDTELSCSRSRLARIVAWAEGREADLPPSGRATVAYLSELADAAYTYEAVTKVEDGGLKPTFDVVLPQTHSFLANGVLSHNTTLSLHIIAEAQRNGGIAAFIDAEHALDPHYARALGVDVDELLISQPDTGEQALEIADMLIRSGALDVVVIDSVAALVPRAEIEGEMGDTHMGLQARLMSQALRKLAGTINRSDTTAVFINQIREKIGVLFGSPETTPGGRALKFYSSVRIEVRRIQTIKEGQDSIGNRVVAKVVKNKVAPPFRKAEFDIMFGEGISREGSLLDVAVEEDVVRKSGAWYTYDDDQLGQGRENAKRFLRENPEVAMQLQARVLASVGLGHADASPPEKDEEGSDEGGDLAASSDRGDELAGSIERVDGVAGGDDAADD
jgi:protein RecA